MEVSHPLSNPFIDHVLAYRCLILFYCTFSCYFGRGPIPNPNPDVDIRHPVVTLATPRTSVLKAH